MLHFRLIFVCHQCLTPFHQEMLSENELQKETGRKYLDLKRISWADNDKSNAKMIILQ